MLKPIIAFGLSNCFICLFENYMVKESILSYLGKKSLEIYVFHIFVTSGIRPIFVFLGITHPVLKMLLAFILGIIVPLFCSFVLHKLKLWDWVFRPTRFWEEHLKK